LVPTLVHQHRELWVGAPARPTAPVAWQHGLHVHANTSASRLRRRERPWARGRGHAPSARLPPTKRPVASSAVQPSHESRLTLRCCGRGTGAPGRRPGGQLSFPGPMLTAVPLGLSLRAHPPSMTHDSYVMDSVCPRAAMGTYWTRPHGRACHAPSTVHCCRCARRSQRPRARYPGNSCTVSCSVGPGIHSECAAQAQVPLPCPDVAQYRRAHTRPLRPQRSRHPGHI
jgi:hypothetical protein